MEENNSRQNEKSREELLEELQKLRSEVNRLNDKMAHMEGFVHGGLQSECAQDGEPESGQSEQGLYRYVPPSYERPSRGQSSHERSFQGQSAYRSLHEKSPYKRFSHAQIPGEAPASRRRASVIPEMRRQRRENRANRGFYQVGEMDVGKYGTAFLAAVCILAGCGLLMVSAWALADELVQALLMFGLGIGMAGCGWLLHQSGKSSAVPTTLAACGLGILYMDCISLHFLWHLVSVEWILPCVLVWAIVSFYMAFSGGTLLFYYVVNLGNLATAILVSSQKEGMTQMWTGLLFTVAAYGFTLFQVFRIGVVRNDGDGRAAGDDGLLNTGMMTDVRDAVSDRTQSADALWRSGRKVEAGGTVRTDRTEEVEATHAPGRPMERKLRWLKNFTAVNVLAAYTILFAGEDSVPLLLFALLLGGIVLIFWRDLYQGGVKEEAAGVFFMECQMAVFCTRLTELLGQWEGAVTGSIVLLLLLAPLLRAGNRNMTAAWILYPMLWVGIALSDLLTGSIYPVSYLILAAYYFYMLLYPAVCKIFAFVPAYIGMYLLLIGETSHPEADITFALMMIFALGLPVKYLVKMMGWQPPNEQFRNGGETAVLTLRSIRQNAPTHKVCFTMPRFVGFRQVNRYGVAMLAAFVICVTYCAAFDKPFVLALEAVMLFGFTGMTSWMIKRDCRFGPILCVGMILLWLMSWKTLEWCMKDGLGLELAAGILFLSAGSLSVWCGIRYGTGWERETLERMLPPCPSGISPEFMVRRLSWYNRVFCPVSLGMFSVSLYRLLLVFRIPYAIFVSLILLFAAVVILLLGFWLSDRTVRTYALFLMAVCVVKMVTTDLAGTGWFWRAGALAGGGMLCMLVSFVYSRREQKEEKQTDRE